MISRNSFLDRCKQNNKRRGWSWFINGIALFMALPFPMLIAMNGERNRVISSGLEAREQLVQMQNSATELLGFQVLTVIAIMALAIYTAIQGYSYLQNRVKVDMYQSQPVSNWKRFFSIYLNGIVCFLIPYMANLVLAFVVALSYRAVNKTVFVMTLFQFFTNTLFYLCVYAAVILVVMITGNLFATILGTGVILVYGAMWECIKNIFMRGFFSTYSIMPRDLEALNVGGVFGYYGERLGLYQGGISVFAYLSNVLNRAMRGVTTQDCYDLRKCILMCLAVIVLTLLSYCAFDKRKAEMVGASIVFPGLKKWLAQLIVVPTALLITKFIGSSAGDSGSFYVIGLVVSVILMHTIVQLIFECRLKRVLKAWKGMLLSIVFAGIVLGTYYFDLVGYDAYVPRQEELSSAAIIVGNSGFCYCDLDKGEKFYYFEQYQMHEMQIKDVEAIRELAMENYFYQNKGQWQNHDKMLQQASKNKAYTVVNVKYRLKNGREIFRELYVDAAACEDLLNRLVGSEEFKEAYFQITDDRWIRDGELRTGAYVNIAGLIYRFTPEQFQDIRSMYLKDLEQFDYTMAANSTPIARLCLSVISDADELADTECYIYPEFVNTIAYLHALQIETSVKWQPEDIRRITIYCYDSNYINSQQQVYEEAEEIAAIMETVQDSNLGIEWVYRELKGEYLDIYIEFTDSRMDSYYYLKNGQQLPDFVLEDMHVF